jgi:hypothetical protein
LGLAFREFDQLEWEELLGRKDSRPTGLLPCDECRERASRAGRPSVSMRLRADGLLPQPRGLPSAANACDSRICR